MKVVQDIADGFDHLQVGALVISADVVGLARPAALQNQPQRARVVLDIEPVAHVVASAVDRQRPAVEGVENDERDQFLREVEGAVIIGAVGEQDRQAIGMVPGPHQMVGGRLAGRIG